MTDLKTFPSSKYILIISIHFLQSEIASELVGAVKTIDGVSCGGQSYFVEDLLPLLFRYTLEGMCKSEYNEISANDYITNVK